MKLSSKLEKCLVVTVRTNRKRDNINFSCWRLKKLREKVPRIQTYGRSSPLISDPTSPLIITAQLLPVLISLWDREFKRLHNKEFLLGNIIFTLTQNRFVNGNSFVHMSFSNKLT